MRTASLVICWQVGCLVIVVQESINEVCVFKTKIATQQLSVGEWTSHRLLDESERHFVCAAPRIIIEAFTYPCSLAFRQVLVVNKRCGMPCIKSK